MSDQHKKKVNVKPTNPKVYELLEILEAETKCSKSNHGDFEYQKDALKPNSSLLKTDEKR